MLEQLDSIASAVSIALLGIVMIPIGLTMIRMIIGPGYASRFVALDMLTGVAVSVAALIASATRRPEFLDVGLGLALIGFVATCAISAFLENKKDEEP